jgi:hypothetical protein
MSSTVLPNITGANAGWPLQFRFAVDILAQAWLSSLDLSVWA